MHAIICVTQSVVFLTQELNGRLQPGTILGATGKREVKSMAELAKIRETEQKVEM
jgi:hypothetical protein